MSADFTIEWNELTPEEAAENELVCIEGSSVIGPINELGEECPWPWEPQQLGGTPMGQYHCGYCGGMQLAGVEHSDWREDFGHPRVAGCDKPFVVYETWGA